MSLEIAWKQNIQVKDSNLLKLQLVVFGFGSQTFVCEFSRQNINSEVQIQKGIFLFLWSKKKSSSQNGPLTLFTWAAYVPLSSVFSLTFFFYFIRDHSRLQEQQGQWFADLSLDNFFDRSLLRGYSVTAWTTFYPILTIYPS